MLKLMQSMKSYGRTLGVGRPDGTGLMTRRNVTALSIYVIYFLLSTAYLLFSANSFREYAMCFFVWWTLVCMIIGFVVMIFQSPLLYGLLDALEDQIERGT